MERVTRQRRAILEACRDAGHPLSPTEIAERARRQVPRLNLATVYRNLTAMVERSELTRVDVLGRPPRYEVAGLPHHHHFLCEGCDRMFDVPGCPRGILDIAPDGFAVTGHELAMTGTCSDCGDPANTS